MEITNLEAPDDETFEHLASLCECYGAFWGRVDCREDDSASAADQESFI